MSLRYLLVILTLFAIGVFEAHALIDSNSYGIVLSQGCKTNLKYNLTTTCPSYQEIQLLFPDTSERKIIGDFGMRDGIYQRLTSNYKNADGYYNSISELNKSVMFIDPPAKLWNRLNIIEIRPNLDAFKLPKNQSYNATEHSLTLGHGRFVDSCRLVYIDSKDWVFLLGDSINLINHNCDPEFTSFKSTKTTYLSKVVHDISTSYKYKLSEWVKQSLARCGQKICFYDQNQTAAP